MKPLKLTVFLPLVLWFSGEIVDCKKSCLKNQYVVVKNGTESCLLCNDCTHGHGLVPPCGSKVNHPPPINCSPCEAGKTYSDDYGPSSCKNCHLCSEHEIVTKACKVDENTICSNTCEKGYYYENSTHNCQPCSECCLDDKDVRIEHECKSMPSNKQCSVHNAQRCKKETSTSIGTGYPTTAISSTSASQRKKQIGLIVGCIILLAIVVIAFIMCRMKKRKKTGNPAVAYNSREACIEDGATHHLLNNDNCDIYHMSFEIINEVPSPISEGQTLSLSLICKNQDDNTNTKCNYSFEWKKDGEIIPRNNYQKTFCHDNAEIADSGRYYCQIRCDEHPNHKEKSNTIDIRVEPGEGKNLKLFKNLDMDILEKVARYLTPKTVDTGNWMNLGLEYEIEESVLKALEKDQAMEVLESIKVTHPKLTVFDFCVMLKKIKQNVIVQILEDHFVVKLKPSQATKKGVSNKTDSGIFDSGIFDDQSDPGSPLQVHIPPLSSTGTIHGSSKIVSKPCHLNIPAISNLSYADSSRETSRESSLEDLAASFKANVQKFKPMDDKDSKSKKLRFPVRRKRSGDSQKSFENNEGDDEGQDVATDKGKRPSYVKQMSRDSEKSVGSEDVGREGKRSRSSSITNSIKEALATFRQPSKDDYLLDNHHEESDESASLC